MNRPLILALALGAGLAGPATAQSVEVIRTPEGSLTEVDRNAAPDVDVQVTGALPPRVIPAFPTSEPAPQPSARAAADRSGCAVQTYAMSENQEVRVHRC